MEDYDDISTGPDENGCLNLSYNTWRKLPDELLHFKESLYQINFSHNHLLSVPNLISSFVLLKEINLSHNSIETIDPGIKECIRLRCLDLSHNKLEFIPSELSSCFMLVRTISIQ